LIPDRLSIFDQRDDVGNITWGDELEEA
jgi:hypothetical protein